MEFLALSSIDFFGGGGGISSVPWCAGLACQVSFASRYLGRDESGAGVPFCVQQARLFSGNGAAGLLDKVQAPLTAVNAVSTRSLYLICKI
jgi:hypothetical protein